MKKTKLLKTISSIACGLGIIGSIPLLVTSCDDSSKIKSFNVNDVNNHQGILGLKQNISVDHEWIITGFKEGWNDPNSNKWDEIKEDGYNAMYIPFYILYNNSTPQVPTAIADNAFTCTNDEGQLLTTIPSFIQYIIFGNEKSKDQKSWIKIFGKSAFENCLSLKKIVLPSSTEQVQSKCFDGCTGVKDIDLSKCKNLAGTDEQGSKPLGLQDLAFDDTNPKTIELWKDPETDEYGTYGFATNVGNAKIVVLRGEEDQPYKLRNGDIGKHAYGIACGSLGFGDVDLRNSGITELSFEAFMGTSITSITLPNSITTYGHSFLEDCDYLTKISWENLTEENLQKLELWLFPQYGLVKRQFVTSQEGTICSIGNNEDKVTSQEIYDAIKLFSWEDDKGNTVCILPDGWAAGK